MNFKELADNIGLDEEDYRELIELFLDTGKADYDKLKHALEASDDEQVARSAHTICGASGNMGLMNVHDVAKRIELSAIKKNLDAVGDDVQALQGLFDEIAQAYQG
ncbi:two component sensor histidine kinase [Desulfosarcina variabilis str. Montpellier]|uniref:Hpt domain-containing protein n=1 Tax=Desulfosarcina variabilis TaxID=2300 RepID=UPI003AFB2069